MFVANNASIFERAWIRTWTGAYPAAQHPPKEQFAASSFMHNHHADAFLANSYIAPQAAFTTGFETTNATMGIAAYPPADTHPFYYLLIWTGVSCRASVPRAPSELTTSLCPLSSILAILSGAAIIMVVQAIVGYYGAYRASVRIHDDMLETVMRSTSRWVSLSTSTA